MHERLVHDMKAARLLALITMMTAIILPWGGSVKADSGVTLQAVGTTVAHKYTRSGVMLASVPCYPAHWLRIPDGLVGQAAEDYVTAHQADLQVTPCAHPTELVLGWSSNIKMNQDQTQFAMARSAYASALNSGATEDVALASAVATFDEPAAIAQPNAITPFTPIVCNGGNFYQYNYDTVLNINGGVNGHIDWEQWYNDSWVSPGVCHHNFNALHYHFIDGSSIWFNKNTISQNGGSTTLLQICANDCNAGFTNIPYSPNILSYDYANNYVTQLGLLSNTTYCTSINFMDACADQITHPNDIVN